MYNVINNIKNNAILKQCFGAAFFICTLRGKVIIISFVHNLFSKKVLTKENFGYNICNRVSTRTVRVLTVKKDGEGNDRRAPGSNTQLDY